jgi:hypothetical protein
MSETLNTAVSTAPWLLLFMAIAATYLWRGLGTAIAAHIDPESALFQWIACVAYGLLVGLLEKSELVDRLGAITFGFCLFFLFKRNVGIGTLSAAGAFMVLVWARTQGIL